MSGPPGPRLLILGKQGAGKGTQCVRLCRHYGVPHISTGDMFRTAVKSGSELGSRLDEYMHAGELIPDDLVIGVVEERLGEDDVANGFVLDGFPRTTNQAEKLSEMLDPADVDLVLSLEVPTEVSLRRLAGRRVCRNCGTNYSVDSPPEQNWTCDDCGGDVVLRGDDTEHAIARRLKLYEQETAPLIAWYSEHDKLVAVDGIGPLDRVTERLVRAVDRRWPAADPVDEVDAMRSAP
ncbi:MAG: adenylate kinase [Actinomycetota bacterium]|nr:adenylate kinase [Actinomycetota bacterium]